MRRYYGWGVVVTFAVIFNLGYVFHDVLMGDWLHEKEAQISRDTYIIPAIAIAFFLYVLIQAYLLPIFFFFAKATYGWSLTRTAITYGALLGFLWDALQGGLIEFATFRMPWEVVAVDSSYHVVEGVITAWVLSLFYKRFVLTAIE